MNLNSYFLWPLCTGVPHCSLSDTDCGFQHPDKANSDMVVAVHQRLHFPLQIDIKKDNQLLSPSRINPFHMWISWITPTRSLPQPGASRPKSSTKQVHPQKYKNNIECQHQKQFLSKQTLYTIGWSSARHVFFRDRKHKKFYLQGSLSRE